MQLVCMWFIVNGKWCIREHLHFSCAARSKQILVRLKPWYDLLAGSLREVIWRFSLGRCWISCHNCHFCRAATVRGSLKNPIASMENDKRSVTRLGDQVFRHQPYKSIEKNRKIDHALLIRAFLPSFPQRPSPVPTLRLWERRTKQTLIKIRAPRLSWGHSEWISARSRGRNLLAAALTHQAVWRKQRLLKELYSAAIRFLYHLCTLIGFCLWQVMCKTPSFNDEWRQLGRGWAITLEVI